MTAVHDGPSTKVPPSPVEVLDRRLRVTTTKTWMVFLGVIVLLAAALVWAIFGSAPTEVKGQSMLLPPHGLYEVGVETEGFVTDVLVQNADHVEAGQALARLRQRDGKVVDIDAPVNGHVATILVKPGTYSNVGTPAFTLVEEGDELIAVVYVPAQEGKVVRNGMRVFVSPSTAPAAQYGSILGTVGSVSTLPASPARIRLNLGDNDALVDFLTGGEPVLEIAVELELDPSTPSGYRWSSGSGPPFTISTATLGTAAIVVSEGSPASQIFG
jgi:multidrug efflux pump subunit AcrA (membrane-fusion protein)